MILRLQPFKLLQQRAGEGAACELEQLQRQALAQAREHDHLRHVLDGHRVTAPARQGDEQRLRLAHLLARAAEQDAGERRQPHAAGVPCAAHAELDEAVDDGAVFGAVAARVDRQPCRADLRFTSATKPANCMASSTDECPAGSCFTCATIIVSLPNE